MNAQFKDVVEVKMAQKDILKGCPMFHNKFIFIFYAQNTIHRLISPMLQTHIFGGGTLSCVSYIDVGFQ